MIEFFNERQVSFVSVTQQISTADSTGRMMLNILMTFAQYERELTTERIRDKVAAAKRRGKHCGGVPVLGYDSSPDKPLLVVNENEAEQVRYIFERFLLFGSAKLVAIDINRQGFRTKSWTTVKCRVREGKPWNTAQIYRVLNNVLYIGKVSHKGTLYDG